MADDNKSLNYMRYDGSPSVRSKLDTILIEQRIHKKMELRDEISLGNPIKQKNLSKTEVFH